MRVLFIGDVVGRPGRRALKEILPRIRSGYDLIVANGENAAGGFGLTPPIAEEIFSCDVHLITTGNHIWSRREILEYIEDEPRLLRPANYPEGVPGRGWGVFQTESNIKFCLINLLGRTFMEPTENPFTTMDSLLERLEDEVKVVILDFHAEASSEKIAMGWYLDGRVSAVIGTHTHVQTADERILPGGTAYITDVGMTGPHDSVIGMKKEPVLRRFITMMPAKFEVAKGDVRLSAVEIEVDERTGKATHITRMQIPLED